MKLNEAYQVLARHWTDQLVIASLGTSTWEWHWLHRETDRVWFHQPTMGLSGSLGLGLAVNLPQANVWVLDGDGGLMLCFGGLLAEAENQPPNLIHFVTSNRSYRTIGEYPLPNQHQTDYVAVARGLGMRNAYRFDAVALLEAQLPAILARREFAFVVLEVEPVLASKIPVRWEGAEMKYRFARQIERQFSIDVFGPSGY